ncbi:hypothetical protein DM39_7038 [Burkholderia cenocepacia]|uniref:Uncharacterized protein n=1 Tax=Burkholderia cenocepacia TaxID=95486 RepID=A0AAN0RM49_9BURK|nr:hypothetical protein DM39_7038 [Burkholderia cenocepacia]
MKQDLAQSLHRPDPPMPDTDPGRAPPDHDDDVPPDVPEPYRDPEGDPPERPPPEREPPDEPPGHEPPVYVPPAGTARPEVPR